MAATLAPAIQVLPATPLPEPGNLPPPTIQNASPELTMARDLVAKNPNDPEAHLTLSLALWDAKEARTAMDELTQAANLAGPKNKDFLLKAVKKFTERGAWGPAVGLYIRLASTDGGKIGLPKEMEDGFHEAVYKASEQKDAQFADLFERVDIISPALGHIARGRQALYQGNLEEAKMQMGNAEKIIPNMPEAKLLKAEIEMKMGSTKEAKDTLLALSPDPETPEWVRLMAENYLKTIQ
jgi:hypothetical protein